MTKKKLTVLLGLVMVAMMVALVGACGGDDEETTTPAPTAKPAATTPPAPEPTAAMAKEEEMEEEDEGMMMEGPLVSVTKSWAWTGDIPKTFQEAPMMAALVAAGKPCNDLSSGPCPSVEDRLPVAEDVLVIPVVEEIGEYGGTWRRGFSGPFDGQNMDRVLMDHPLLYDLDGATLLPNLVKSWDVSSDGLTYTFKLRRGMKWSDGAPFTVDDIMWTNEHMIHNKTLNASGEGRLGFSQFAPVLKKIDDVTFTASFPDVQAGFIDEMGTYRIGGLSVAAEIGAPLFAPSHFLKEEHEDTTSDKAALDKRVKDSGFESWATYFKRISDIHSTPESPSLGPWRTVSSMQGDLWAFERNPYYYAVDPAGNQLPYIDFVELRLYSDSEVHNLRAIAGEYDFNHRGISFSKLPVYKENQEKGNYRMILWPGDSTMAVGFNYSYGEQDDPAETPDPEIKKWLRDKKFKQALSVAVDRPKVNELLYFGTGIETQPVFPTWHAHYPGLEIQKRYTQYDPALANKWLDEVGLDKKDGSGFRLRTDGSGKRLTLELAFGTSYSGPNNPAELLKQDWAAVGIDTRLKPEEAGLFQERRGQNVHELTLDGDVQAREPTSPLSGRSAFPAYSNWYASRGGGAPSGAASAEPPASDTTFGRLVELSDEASTLRYIDRKQNYLENQDITSEELYYIGLIGHTAAGNGTIVVKNNFRNVPARAPNLSALQNPGTGRPVQFFFRGGLNDAGY